MNDVQFLKVRRVENSRSAYIVASWFRTISDAKLAFTNNRRDNRGTTGN